jgi:excinuclease ABC subunit B
MATEYKPAGDQPTAIADLVAGANENERNQVLLGVTGSGKTFTMAKVIEETQRPAVILAPNKTLAAQLYSEFRNFFPDNAVEYFVSYYDYYQPEAYVPRTDTFIEKESTINEQIDRMRHSATRALMERDDVIIVASVSCIYGIGSVETYTAMTFQMAVGDRIDQRQLLADLVAQQYKRRDMDFQRGSFRVRGDTIELFPAHLEDRGLADHAVRRRDRDHRRVRPAHRQKTGDLKSVKIYANSHYVTPRPTLNQATKSIREELKHRLAELEASGRLLEAQRLEQRTRFDLEMLEATGVCQGIENYSRYLTGRARASRRRRCSNTSPTTRSCSSTRAMSRSRRSAACTAATSAARRRWPSTASGCPPASTTGRSASRNGTRCGPRPSPSRPRPATGRWSRPAASSPNR